MVLLTRCDDDIVLMLYYSWHWPSQNNRWALTWWLPAYWGWLTIRSAVFIWWWNIPVFGGTTRIDYWPMETSTHCCVGIDDDSVLVTTIGVAPVAAVIVVRCQLLTAWLRRLRGPHSGFGDGGPARLVGQNVGGPWRRLRRAQASDSRRCFIWAEYGERR